MQMLICVWTMFNLLPVKCKEPQSFIPLLYLSSPVIKDLLIYFKFSNLDSCLLFKAHDNHKARG